MGVVVADARFGSHPVSAALRAIASDSVAGPLEARIARRVHVQQVARTRPLVAVGGLARLLRRPRDAVAVEHLPDRRMRAAGGPGDQARSPAGAQPALTDALLRDRIEQARARARAARAVEQPGARGELLV